MNRPHRYRAIIGIATQQLRNDRLRTVLAVVGVALAVLAATLLASTGYGVVQTGQSKFASSGRDLWVTGGPVQLTPGRVGGVSASIHDAHRVSQQLNHETGVQSAAPMLFQTVYVGSNTSNLDTVVAVGVPKVGQNSASFTAGGGFSQRGQVHYANGKYTGPHVREAILDPQLATRYNTTINSSLHIGGTVRGARDTSFRVVGMSRTFSKILGTPTVTVPLSELQTMTGTASTDQATFITISLTPNANAKRVAAHIQKKYPGYDVRTNKQELQAVLANKLVIIASGLTLVVLAILAGLALTMNILALLVYQQRKALAALRSIGVSRVTLAGIVATQGVLLGLLGGALGLALTPIMAALLNRIAVRLVGFHGLVQTPTWVFAAGAAIAVIIGGLSAAVAGWQVSRVNPLEHLNDA